MWRCRGAEHGHGGRCLPKVARDEWAGAVMTWNPGGLAEVQNSRGVSPLQLVSLLSVSVIRERETERDESLAVCLEKELTTPCLL